MHGRCSDGRENLPKYSGEDEDVMRDGPVRCQGERKHTSTPLEGTDDQIQQRTE